MKKSYIILGVIFLTVILPLVFLAARFFLTQNNFGYTKISWEKSKEEVLDDLISASPVSPESAVETPMEEAKKPVEKITEKSTTDYLDIKNHLVNWGFTASASRNIDTIVIHSSYDALSGKPYSLEGLINEYQQYGVAPHYLIDRQGVIYRLVADKNVAYHAGESQTPDGRKNVNDFSLGVEIMTTKTDAPTDQQYAALQKLIDFCKGNYKIKYILGHSQIAQGRKDDPWNFDWKKIIK
jgi:N-acetyl-anhydromuramyl-L-alanine amidase AmpD